MTHHDKTKEAGHATSQKDAAKDAGKDAGDKQQVKEAEEKGGVEHAW